MPAKNKLSLSVQYPDQRLAELLTRPKVRRWVQAALFAPAELTIRFVDAEDAFQPGVLGVRREDLAEVEVAVGNIEEHDAAGGEAG